MTGFLWCRNTAKPQMAPGGGSRNGMQPANDRSDHGCLLGLMRPIEIRKPTDFFEVDGGRGWD